MYTRNLKLFKELEVEHGACSAKLRSLKEVADARLQMVGSIQSEFDEFANRVKNLEATMHDEAQKLVTQQIMKARVETMMEFLRGEWSSSDVADTVKIYNEAYPDDAFPDVVVEGEGGNLGPKSVADVSPAAGHP